MADTQPQPPISTRTRSSGLFIGLVLISVGVLLLLHNYGRLELDEFFTRWWPLLIIFWGVVKVYERALGRRFGGSGGAITGGEVFLVFAMLALLGMVVAYDYAKGRIPEFPEVGESYSFDLDVPAKAIPATAPVSVRAFRGDITVRGSEDSAIRISGKKNVRTWNEPEANRIAEPVSVEINQNGPGYEVHPSGYNERNGRISVDLEIAVPKNSPLSVTTNKGDVSVSDLASAVAVVAGNGSVELHTTKGDVTLEMRKGDAKVEDTQGDVKISGKGGEIDVNHATGSLTIDGDFYGPVRAERVSRGVRMVSARTDLTVASLAGHLEAGSGNLELVDAGGTLDLRTRDTEVDVENATGKMNIENRNAQTTVRFPSAPKEDVQITNSSAGISLAVPGNASFEIQVDCRNCDIESEFASLSGTKTESGDSHLAAKFGSGKGPKIILKTSYGNIELRRSTAPIPPPPKVPAPPKAPTPPSDIPPAEEQ